MSTAQILADLRHRLCTHLFAAVARRGLVCDILEGYISSPDISMSSFDQTQENGTFLRRRVSAYRIIDIYY